MLNRWPSHGHWPHSSAAEVSQSTHFTLSLQYRHADMLNTRRQAHKNSLYFCVLTNILQYFCVKSLAPTIIHDHLMLVSLFFCIFHVLVLQGCLN